MTNGQWRVMVLVLVLLGIEILSNKTVRDAIIGAGNIWNKSGPPAGPGPTSLYQIGMQGASNVRFPGT